MIVDGLLEPKLGFALTMEFFWKMVKRYELSEI